MAKSTDVAVKQSEDVALQKAAELEAELAAQNVEASDANDLQIPLLKVGQALTQEVADGEARPGEFINSLTREGLGREVEFIVSAYRKGRFDHGDRNAGKKARKAYGQKTVPWKDDPFYGRPFTEHPEAEERYSQRVNNDEIEWGKGPKISTTYDFTGYVISGLEEDEHPIPVCLSLMRMNTKQAKKWITLLDAVLRGRYWDKVFTLTTEQQRDGTNNYYTVGVKQGRSTTPEERQQAVDLALAVRNMNVEFVGEDDSEAAATAKPADNGGMEV